MIIAEIKLHEEPGSVVYQSPAPTKPLAIMEYCGYTKRTFTQADLKAERSKAALAFIKIDSKFKYRNTGAIIEVTSYVTDPDKCEDVEGSPAVLICRRTLNTKPDKVWTFTYSVDELTENELMEKL